QLGVLAAGFDALGVDDRLATRDRGTPLGALGGFLALRTPHADRLRQALRDRGVAVDSRGEVLRLGPAPYLSDAQLEAGIAALGEALSDPALPVAPGSAGRAAGGPARRGRPPGRGGGERTGSGHNGGVTDAAPPPSPVFLYDGDCSFCTTCANFIERRIPTSARVVPWQFTD